MKEVDDAMWEKRVGPSWWQSLSGMFAALGMSPTGMTKVTFGQVFFWGGGGPGLTLWQDIFLFSPFLQGWQIFDTDTLTRAYMLYIWPLVSFVWTSVQD